VGNLHVNFTVAVYSTTNITSLFYPVSKFSYFAFAIVVKLLPFCPSKSSICTFWRLFAAYKIHHLKRD